LIHAVILSCLGFIVKAYVVELAGGQATRAEEQEHPVLPAAFTPKNRDATREVAVKPFDERLYVLKLQAALVPRMHRDTDERRRKVLSRQREIGQAKAGALHKIADSDIGVIRDYIPEVDTVVGERGSPTGTTSLQNSSAQC
jgi:hypothetical protein